MWAFVVGGSKGGRVPPPSSPFEPMANWMHRNLNVNHYSLVVFPLPCGKYLLRFFPYSPCISNIKLSCVEVFIVPHLLSGRHEYERIQERLHHSFLAPLSYIFRYARPNSLRYLFSIAICAIGSPLCLLCLSLANRRSLFRYVRFRRHTD